MSFQPTYKAGDILIFTKDRFGKKIGDAAVVVCDSRLDSFGIEEVRIDAGRNLFVKDYWACIAFIQSFTIKS